MDKAALDQLTGLIPTAESGGRKNGADDSRSAVSFRTGLAMRRAGRSYEEFCEAVRTHAASGTRYAEKGIAGGGRELERIWQKAEPKTQAPQAEWLSKAQRDRQNEPRPNLFNAMLALREARLSNLHEAAGHLARTAPDILVQPEVAKALEHGLLHAMVLCISGGEAAETDSVHHRHTGIMRRLEELLEANSDRTLYLTELCSAAGVSERTLRACCQEHLGMSPTRYFWLRRMHLARRDLRIADPAATSVTEVVTRHGFWELGRFSVAYRSLFGESPSAALRRPPNDPRSQENTASP